MSNSKLSSNISPLPNEALKKKPFFTKKMKVIMVCIIALLIVIFIIYSVVSHYNKQEQEKLKNIISSIESNSLNLAAEYDPLDDEDEDGVRNKNEEELSTNIYERDTDRDGICDGNEIDIGTDPLKNDTDGDGILDGYEIMMGLDPRNQKTDGTDDATRRFTITKTAENASLVVGGTANINDIVFDKLALVGFQANSGILSDAMNFYTDYTFDKATITINVNQQQLKNKKISYADLSIFKFDAKEQKFISVDSTADEKSGTLSAKITECATYMVGNKNVISSAPVNRIQIVIDNSGSMYPTSVYENTDENDVDFKRLDLAHNIVDKLDSSSLIGISKFTGTYTELCKFTQDRKTISDAIDSIKTNAEIFNGTAFFSALSQTIAKFDNADGNYSNLIIMLCDGGTSDEKTYDIDKIIADAKSRGVIVLTIGLGHNIDTALLQKIAEETGGKYYTASDADALSEVFKQIITTFNYEIINFGENSDRVGYSIANSGFVPSVNGFSFNNFRTTSSNGTCFGMAMFAREWYTGNLSIALGEYTPDGKSTKKFTAMPYNLNDTDISKLYSEKKQLSSVTVSAANDTTYSKLTEYADFSSKGITLLTDEKKLEQAREKGYDILDYNIQDLGLDVDWQYVQFIALDVENKASTLSDIYGTSEVELYKALLRYHVLQWDSKENVKFDLADGEECFNKVKADLMSGIPSVLMINERHAVNAISIVQDAYCPRRFIISIYDNNYSGETKEITVEKVSSAVFKDGKYTDTEYCYIATYEGENVALSYWDVKVS